ncbi:MAG: hypothetical protein MJZ45_00315 [Bacteroidales bacterium]|nr:hypothetical protein [Bacteroidales bacterium]
MKKLKIVLIAAAALSMGITANAQSKWGDTPDDSIACISNVSLYQEFYKQKLYTDCYEPWRQILLHCPRYSRTPYQRASTIMHAMIATATTEEERNAYIEELMNAYDQRIQYFGESAKVKAMKAQDLSTLKPTDYKRIYEIYAEAVSEGIEQIDENYTTLFFAATVDYVKAGYAEPTLIIDNYDIVTTRLEDISETVVDDSVKLAKIAGYINNVEAVFSPYATCEQLNEIYQKKFEADPHDINLLKKITYILTKKDCTEDNKLFFDAATNLYELEPTPQTALMMAEMCWGKKQYGKAVEYAQDAVKSLTEKKDLYNAYIVMGRAYSGQGSYSAARNSFLRAAEIDRSKGYPYIFIAMAYASGSRSIDDGMGGRSAYWAAVDELSRAKQVEPTEQVAKIVDRLSGQYRSYFPKKKDAFMLDLIDGHSYVVPGWIGKSTIIRTR